MVLNKDFKEFIKLLNEYNVKYLVVGGYAVAFHGHPRYTKDLDIWIKRGRNNAVKIVNVLNEFGFGKLGINKEDFLNPDIVIQLGNPPNRIDLLTELTGVKFEECYKSKQTVTIKNFSIHYIDLQHLKKNKRAVGRHQDLADIENLE